MQEASEGDASTQHDSYSFSSNKGQRRLPPQRLSDLAKGLHKIPVARMTHEAITYKVGRPGGHASLRTRVVFMMPVVVLALVYILWGCAMQLRAGQWREEASVRLLAAGGGEGDIFQLCRSGQGEPLGSQGTIARKYYTPEEQELLNHAAIVISSFAKTTNAMEGIILNLQRENKHKIASLLFSFALVELSAISMLVGGDLHSELVSTFVSVKKALERVSPQNPEGIMPNADSKYRRLHSILKKFSSSVPTKSYSGPDRIQQLRELLHLQEVGLTQVRTAFNYIWEAIWPPEKGTMEIPEHAFSLLSHTVYVRKNHIVRNPTLNQWLLDNEIDQKHSPVLPRSYLKAVLKLPQLTFDNCLSELTDPRLPCGGPKGMRAEGPQARQALQEEHDGAQEGPSVSGEHARRKGGPSEVKVFEGGATSAWSVARYSAVPPQPLLGTLTGAHFSNEWKQYPTGSQQPSQRDVENFQTETGKHWLELETAGTAYAGSSGNQGRQGGPGFYGPVGGVHLLPTSSSSIPSPSYVLGISPQKGERPRLTTLETPLQLETQTEEKLSKAPGAARLGVREAFRGIALGESLSSQTTESSAPGDGSRNFVLGFGIGMPSMGNLLDRTKEGRPK
ncbi:hypothetical protein, conserved [Eimeria maxima]|uniref:Uncharacterized protein n=1 Tax=Eimeria maxima TaxID=5804 RepID=U6M379_EIMMA|nr:hypothetical protein, conserved [Eimeria maxima]CDJ56135.1 hypothetical protein, conserved [Eimeria maxima]